VDYADVHDANSKEARIVKAGICAGFYPQILRVENPLPKFTKLAGANPLQHGCCSKPQVAFRITMFYCMPHFHFPRGY
jgi:hypothetical protein